MIRRIVLRRLRRMPAELEPGILYVVEEFKAAAHLCACGCGSVVRTPLNRWTLTETTEGPSLDPSVGNWQEPCESHYFIERGRIVSCRKWSKREIEAGRRREQEQLDSLYATVELDSRGKLKKLWDRIRRLFRAR